VHNAGVVEDDVDAAPFVGGGDGFLDGCLVGDVAFDGCELAWVGGDNGSELLDGIV
jgi:hypothetical protein